MVGHDMQGIFVGTWSGGVGGKPCLHLHYVIRKCRAVGS